MRLVNADEFLLLHPLNQLFNQLVQRAVHHHLLDLLPRFVVQ